MQVLATEAAQYGRSAAALQGGLGGDARGADLPSRLAAQQMAALAGMSLKVGPLNLGFQLLGVCGSRWRAGRHVLEGGPVDRP
jgi:hypothetical protein